MQYLHPICNQLYNFYRSNESELKCFTLQFFPNMIYLYLNAVASSEKQNYRCVETLILCAYNIEVCSENGLLKSVSYRMPVLAQASIYHEEKNLHASDLKVIVTRSVFVYLPNYKNIYFISCYLTRRDGRSIATRKSLGDRCIKCIK